MFFTMCKPFILLLLVFSTIAVHAQNSQPITTYLNEVFEPVADETLATNKEERWPDKQGWKARVLDVISGKLTAEYGFADSTRQFKQGTAIYYGRNGKRIGMETYEMGLRNGPYAFWWLDGLPRQKGTYKNNKPTDTITLFNIDGKIKALMFLNEEGHGTGKEFFNKAGVTGEGKVVAGKQDGPWVYKNRAGKKVMEVVYNEKGIESETCFGPDEKPLTGQECASDKPAEFPGGADGWRRFLEKNLKYPKSARRDEIQGVVSIKFNVATDGSISNIRILTAPSDDLAAEATRILEKSPNWIPAREANKVVSYNHIQSITFRLE